MEADRRLHRIPPSHVTRILTHSRGRVNRNDEESPGRVRDPGCTPCRRSRVFLLFGVPRLRGSKSPTHLCILWFQEEPATPEDSGTRLKAELQTGLTRHEVPTETIETLGPPAQTDMHPLTGQNARAGRPRTSIWVLMGRPAWTIVSVVVEIHATDKPFVQRSGWSWQKKTRQR
jgi:hypothetical protein